MKPSPAQITAVLSASTPAQIHARLLILLASGRVSASVVLRNYGHLMAKAGGK